MWRINFLRHGAYRYAVLITFATFTCVLKRICRCKDFLPVLCLLSRLLIYGNSWCPGPWKNALDDVVGGIFFGQSRIKRADMAQVDHWLTFLRSLSAYSPLRLISWKRCLMLWKKTVIVTYRKLRASRVVHSDPWGAPLILLNRLDLSLADLWRYICVGQDSVMRCCVCEIILHLNGSSTVRGRVSLLKHNFFLGFWIF